MESWNENHISRQSVKIHPCKYWSRVCTGLGQVQYWVCRWTLTGIPLTRYNWYSGRHTFTQSVRLNGLSYKVARNYPVVETTKAVHRWHEMINFSCCETVLSSRKYSTFVETWNMLLLIVTMCSPNLFKGYEMLPYFPSVIFWFPYHKGIPLAEICILLLLNKATDQQRQQVTYIVILLIFIFEITIEMRA